MILFCCCFFLYFTATPEIYTYLHTLSLPDALPISPWSRVAFAPARTVAATKKACKCCPCWFTAMRLSRGRASSWKPLTRSEEHTSELQSLMRISYAVFCLKKKKQTAYTHITDTQNQLSTQNIESHNHRHQYT